MTAEVKNIEISVDAYEKLRGVQEALEKILRKKQVSFDQVIKTMLATHPLDVILQDYMLEDTIKP